jgi:hypothetical protein
MFQLGSRKLFTHGGDEEEGLGAVEDVLKA